MCALPKKVPILLSCVLIITKIVNFCKKRYENLSINYFWSDKSSLDVLHKLKSVQFPFSAIDSYDFLRVIPYTTLSHRLIEESLLTKIDIKNVILTYGVINTIPF